MLKPAIALSSPTTRYRELRSIADLNFSVVGLTAASARDYGGLRATDARLEVVGNASVVGVLEDDRKIIVLEDDRKIICSITADRSRAFPSRG